MTILATRIIYYAHPAWIVGVMVCIAIIITMGVLIDTSTNYKWKIWVMVIFIGILLGLLVTYIVGLGSIQETQYLILIDENMSFSKFNLTYEIKEELAENLFWCIKK